jgi:type I restriction enzyme R subunit
MTPVAPWGTPDYREIVGVTREHDSMRVEFADQTSAVVDPSQLHPAFADGIDWAGVTWSSHAISVPAAGGDVIDIPWDAIRVLSDPAFADHTRGIARQQAADVGKRLRALRMTRGLSSKELAERAEITPQSLSRIEHGHHDVVFSTLRRLLGAMGYTLRDLASLEETPPGAPSAAGDDPDGDPSDAVLSEADTRSRLIDPKLRDVGWSDALVDREYAYKRGRIHLLGDEPLKEPPLYVDYLLRHKPNGLPLAVVEAKSVDRDPGSGLQQAIAYAADLGIRFAFATNGREIVEQDLETGDVTRRDAFPSPDDLYRRLQVATTALGLEVMNPAGSIVRNPLLEPVFSLPGGRQLRYYQERAITAGIASILRGDRRGLLSIATGTGKTFIAANLVWKLVRSGYYKKVLFLVDRVVLLNQAYHEFSIFGDARGTVSSQEIPVHRDIHFATYQTLYSGRDGDRTYEQYPRQYFDLIVVDECHRSGYGDWRVILDHFDGAYALGMTATPKRDDSIDTFSYFGSEQADEHGAPQPLFSYSMGQGIEDGFLATFQVNRVRTDVDLEGLHVYDEVSRGAELVVPEGTSVQDVYRMTEFEREIVIPDRTEVLCQHLAGRLRSWGALDKTMVFCVTMDHAELVRERLQSLLGTVTGRNLYAARIVSEERDAQLLLEQFRRSDSTEPVVATTVDLLATGVDVPSCRNVVFMKPIGSSTGFKQIVGRGCRLDPATNKEFFRIVDYTNATRLFDSWDLPQEPPLDEGPSKGNGRAVGIVRDVSTGDPLAEAPVAAVVRRAKVAQTLTDSEGSFELTGLPDVPVTLVATKTGFIPRRVKVQPDADEPAFVSLDLNRIVQGGQKVEISGVTVTIAEETFLTLGQDGRQLTAAEYAQHAGRIVREAVPDGTELFRVWRDPETRRIFREQLRRSDVDPGVLALILKRSDADEGDALAHAAFGSRLASREERARRLEQFDGEFLAGFTGTQRAVVEELIDQYRVAGVEEIASASVFQLEPFARRFGGITALSRMFGGPSSLRETLVAIQHHLYPLGEVAA